MMEQDHHDRRFHGDEAMLRSADRVAMLEPDRVLAFSLNAPRVQSVLDVGTGTGLFAEAFAAAGLVVTGVDVNTELLQTARQHVPGCRFVEGSAEALPFDDKSFDLVFMAHVLHETDDALEALRGAGRVARVRVVVVEWPYRQEEHGPPLHHRLPAHRIQALAESAGLVRESELTLSHVDVYSFRPK